MWTLDYITYHLFSNLLTGYVSYYYITKSVSNWCNTFGRNGSQYQAVIIKDRSVWIFVAKLPSVDVDFAVDFGFFCSKGKGPQKFPPKAPETCSENAPRISVSAFSWMCMVSRNIARSKNIAYLNSKLLRIQTIIFNTKFLESVLLFWNSQTRSS